MTCRAALVTALLALAAVLGPAPPLAAQGGEAARPEEGGRPGDTYGWYVVRPGDTLRGITERYLGTGALWRENWELNPGVRDPNLLRPGQRLRVIVSRELPPRTAAVEEVAGRVDEKPQPQPWVSARPGDLLRESDGLRTFERSSAELRFDDDTELRLTEGSLVFLRRLGTTLTGEFQDTVEIVEGQADLVARRPARPRDIEIVLGRATARPRPTGGVAESRVRRSAGAGQLMVYRGDSAMEAAGVTVQVAAGMGTTVPDGAPPSPPERLLPAPGTLEPAPGARLGFANPVFRWRSQDGAEVYTVEVCRDADCALLVERAAAVAGTEWRPEALPAADLFWRVTAVAASGLDGYPGGAVPFAVTSGRRDLEPPVVAFVGRGLVEAEPGGRRVSVGPGGALIPALHDDASGVVSVEVRWDGGPWAAWGGGALEPPAGAGAAALEVRARDGVGRERVQRVEVLRDTEAPEPPRVGG